MFNIVVINFEELQNQSYLNLLEENECYVHPVERNPDYDLMDEIDAFIIVETNSQQQMHKTCEAIIKIRAVSTKLIWVLTGNSTKLNRMIYLRLGCDGVLNQKMASEEFALYVKVTLERQNGHKSLPIKNSEDDSLQNKESSLKLIPQNISVMIDGNREVNLTRREYKALELLRKHEGKVIHYSTFYEHIWGDRNNNGNYRIANLICQLRKKVEKDYKNPKYIKTIHSRGYKFSN